MKNISEISQFLKIISHIKNHIHKMLQNETAAAPGSTQQQKTDQ